MVSEIMKTYLKGMEYLATAIFVCDKDCFALVIQILCLPVISARNDANPNVIAKKPS